MVRVGIRIRPMQGIVLISISVRIRGGKMGCRNWRGGEEFVGKCRDSLDEFEAIAGEILLAGKVEVAILAVREVRLV